MREHDNSLDHRNLVSLKNWGERPGGYDTGDMLKDVAVDCGWGRLIFGQTFDDPANVARILASEEKRRRDVAFYVREPQVLLASAPQDLFLDPSHTYRLDLEEIPDCKDLPCDLEVIDAAPADTEDINRLYAAWRMVPVPDGFMAKVGHNNPLTVLVAKYGETIVGVVMGVDHRLAFNDPDNGSSLWALAVDPQTSRPHVGEMLVVALADRFRKAGRSFMDLSVMHDNKKAIALYRKLGFEQVPVYSVKKKNPINEKLYVGPRPEESLNIYAQILVDEARRRGIAVRIEDANAGLFKLSFGGRSISCRESLSDLTSAVALSRCDDKALTRRIVKRAGVKVPDQIVCESDDQAHEFLHRHERIVVKPARGEQGRGVAVDLRMPEEVDAAVAFARTLCDEVLLEEYVKGKDLRVIVIDGDVVAAAVRRPPCVVGDGSHSIRQLVEAQSRRRAAATNGESLVPIDDETERTIRKAGYGLGDVLPGGERLAVRKTANLHTGGTIHDVTADLHPELADISVRTAKALDIPVVGLDLLVADPTGPAYKFIEANERAGLANHEPQPTAERFIDFLFPQTVRSEEKPNGSS